jgi:hypothetical protein
MISLRTVPIRHCEMEMTDLLTSIHLHINTTEKPERQLPVCCRQMNQGKENHPNKP